MTNSITFFLLVTFISYYCNDTTTMWFLCNNSTGCPICHAPKELYEWQLSLVLWCRHAFWLRLI